MNHSRNLSDGLREQAQQNEHPNDMGQLHSHSEVSDEEELSGDEDDSRDSEGSRDDSRDS